MFLAHVDDGQQVLGPLILSTLKKFQCCIQPACAEQAVCFLERNFRSYGLLRLDQMKGIIVPAQHNLSVQLGLQRLLVPFSALQNYMSRINASNFLILHVSDSGSAVAAAL